MAPTPAGMGPPPGSDTACASSYLKLHYPAAFTTALRNNQPMGFYAPNTLIADARRHGVHIEPVDVNASAADTTLRDPDPSPPTSNTTRASRSR